MVANPPTSITLLSSLPWQLLRKGLLLLQTDKSSPASHPQRGYVPMVFGDQIVSDRQRPSSSTSHILLEMGEYLQLVSSPPPPPCSALYDSLCLTLFVYSSRHWSTSLTLSQVMTQLRQRSIESMKSNDLFFVFSHDINETLTLTLLLLLLRPTKDSPSPMKIVMTSLPSNFV
jgi:hypothetical protein